jgi:DNA-binding transcriptional LysR family regulator
MPKRLPVVTQTMDRLLSMQVFEKVVSEGGFAAAARSLDLSPTVVSRLVSDLEEHLGTRLIQRTTRKLALTESGNIYLSKLRGILQEVNDAEDAAQNSAGRLSGTLHVLTTPLLASYFLAPLVYAWRTRHPQVVLDISVDPFSHLRVEEFDLTLMAVEEGYDADTVARVLGRTESILCAAPSYLDRAGVPVQPSDLHQHDQLKFPWQKAPGHSSGHGIRLTHVAGLSEPVDVQMNVVLQSLCLDVLLHAALAGAGLCLLSGLLAQPHLRDGSLMHVLPDWQAGGLTVYAALPTRKFVPARVAAMLDFVTEAAQQVFPGVAP